MAWLSGGERSLIMCLAVSTQYRRVRQKDGRTDVESVLHSSAVTAVQRHAENSLQKYTDGLCTVCIHVFS